MLSPCDLLVQDNLIGGKSPENCIHTNKIFFLIYNLNRKNVDKS